MFVFYVAPRNMFSLDRWRIIIALHYYYYYYYYYLIIYFIIIFIIIIIINNWRHYAAGNDVAIRKPHLKTISELIRNAFLILGKIIILT